MEIRWHPPPRHWVALKTDGSVCPNTNSASIGGFLHDSAGNWICGFTCAIKTSTALQTEFWAIHDGLYLAWQLGFRFVQIQSDAISVIKYPAAASPGCINGIGISTLLEFTERRTPLLMLWQRTLPKLFSTCFS
ncbi:hypothetical protein F3Y22_tig00110319pilonHSYRG00408 [Hibiscus syriacus]|uniref:RNase H type-1 domain-containing protein n=1 Tax=Hibiscus syriacus TaxID=106335 RepID=A0A6A3B6A3_HIBSY|nr:hypothetical protein F3Y22_tig00110319pilonHSYRG00408 [Hibiscus syriacus]